MLRLYVNSVLTPGTFDVYQVNDSWSESTLNYNNASLPGASATGGNPVDVTTSSVNHFIMVDITPLAQGWASRATPNNGVALALAGGSTENLGSFSFDIKENYQTGHLPELEIVFDGNWAEQCTPASGVSPLCPETADGEHLPPACTCAPVGVIPPPAGSCKIDEAGSDFMVSTCRGAWLCRSFFYQCIWCQLFRCEGAPPTWVPVGRKFQCMFSNCD
jgi:hypothetical protein